MFSSKKMLTGLVTEAAAAGTPTVVVLNKIDLLTEKLQLLPLVAELRGMVDEVVRAVLAHRNHA